MSDKELAEALRVITCDRGRGAEMSPKELRQERKDLLKYVIFDETGNYVDRLQRIARVDEIDFWLHYHERPEGERTVHMKGLYEGYLNGHRAGLHSTTRLEEHGNDRPEWGGVVSKNRWEEKYQEDGHEISVVVAHHEAGHAVAYIWTDTPFEYVTVIPEDSRYGHIEHHEKGELIGVDNFHVYLMGIAAQGALGMLNSHLLFPSGDIDPFNKEAERIWNWAYRPWTSPKACLVRMILWIRILCRRPPVLHDDLESAESLDEFKELVRTRATTLAGDPDYIAAVKAVAVELLKKRELSYFEVKDIVDKSQAAGGKQNAR